ncbi:MAG TPA: beta-ketoacyl synthase N-terminal-like domain-containing protein, partial [Vicinamibacteria bacterium]|nr:beta-ketoacyl synthase N-terminal-like domain-containing protein [Vicinamibacteria bacterium]
MHAQGARTFVEVGPKKALKSFVEDVLGDRGGIVSLFTNHPRPGEVQTFNHALCGLYAAGYGQEEEAPIEVAVEGGAAVAETRVPPPVQPTERAAADAASAAGILARALAEALPAALAGRVGPHDRNQPPDGSVVITGMGLGLPGAEKAVMDPSNVERILRGEQFVDLIPERFRRLMARKHVTRVVKGEDGSGHFETIEDTGDVIKLAGRPGAFDLAAEYGVPPKLVEALDVTTQLAMAAGLDALREAGIPLVLRWRATTTGRHLPDRWMLPEALRDETGVIFASAFPGLDRFADEAARYYTDESRRERRDALRAVREAVTEPAALQEIDRRLAEIEEAMAREPYAFDRRFLLRVLAMGHSQFAEYVGARGPNTHVNAACAGTAQAIALAEDWIRGGRCRRVLVIGADNATGPHLLEWMGAGFLASGAAATDD